MWKIPGNSRHVRIESFSDSEAPASVSPQKKKPGPRAKHLPQLCPREGLGCLQTHPVDLLRQKRYVLSVFFSLRFLKKSGKKTHKVVEQKHLQQIFMYTVIVRDDESL